MTQYDMHAIVKGRVQNVGFRATVRYYATQLGLVGTVRNLVDGSVEIHAQGSKEALEQLLNYLRQEPGLGHIDDIELNYREASKSFTGFSILYSET